MYMYQCSDYKNTPKTEHLLEETGTSRDCAWFQIERIPLDFSIPLTPTQRLKDVRVAQILGPGQASYLSPFVRSPADFVLVG